MADFLLVHGMCVGAWEWERVAPALRAGPRAGTVIAPDMPGRRRRAHDSRDIRLADYTRTVIAALRDNDLRDVIIVGHSAGGIFLQAIAAAEPERVRRMVFLAAAVPERGRDILHRQPLPARLMSRLLLTLLRADSRGIVPDRRRARRELCDALKRTECREPRRTAETGASGAATRRDRLAG